MKRLVLIDGKSVFYRGYYAMGALSLSDGTPTGGVYGFAAIAMEIVRRLNPTKVVVAWDSKTSTSKRRALYPEYKAGRVKPGEDFYTQIPLLRELVSELGWSFVEIDDYEADDIIGTLSRQADELSLGKDPEGEDSWQTFIVSSDLDMLQIVDENTHMWRILKGFSDIEKINVKEIEQKYGILKSQFLDLKALKGDSSDNIPGVAGVGEKTAVKLLNQYGDLDNIYANIDNIDGSVHKKLVAGKESAYLSKKLAQIMFDAPVRLSDIPDFHFDYARVVEGLKKLEFNSLVRKLERDSPESEIASSRDSSESRNSTTSDTNELAVELPDIIELDVKAVMHENEGAAKEILGGAKFWDLGQAEFLLNPLGRDKLEVSSEAERKALCARQFGELSKIPKLLNVYQDLDLPLIPVLYKMEKKGMLIDREYFSNLQKEYTAEIRGLEEKIWQLAGVSFNINSPIQLSDVLFNKLELPTKGIKKTTRGFSTGARELEKLQDLHPIIPEIIKYREAAKLLSTYIVPMPELADEDGRIHTTFTQNVTATGRLSSKDPNLQNIPVRTEEGRRIRTGFVAPSGRVLVSADYSQFELRLAAVLSGDEALISDFNQDIDIHTKTASEAFNVPMDKVTKAQRRAAKVINFGILYGMSANGLAEAAKMSIGEAKKFIDNYFALRAPIKQKLEEILKQAREKGYVETYYGRRRPTPDVKSSNYLIRQAAERAAQNMPIQGTEADLMKRAMINVDKTLPEGAEIVMQVHDSIIVECGEKNATEVAKSLKEEMETIAPELRIKLAVEVTIGQNWGEL